MNLDSLSKTKIFSRVTAEAFVGRSAELETLRQHALDETDSRGMLLLSPPAAGASELLFQCYDRLFYEQGELIPFYFAINRRDKTAKECALRFLQTFLLQTVAFRSNYAKLLTASPAISEIAGLVSSIDAQWINQLINSYQSENSFRDERSFIKNCLSAPLRAVAHGTPVFVMIDDLQNAESFAGETNFVEELKEIYSRSATQFVFAGRRRYGLKACQSGVTKLNNLEILRLNEFSANDAELLIENFSKKYAVKTNEASRDLIIRQFNANPLLTESLFIAANEREKDLDSFQNVQQIYVDELFGSRIGKYYDTQFAEVASNFKTQTELIRLLYKTQERENRKSKSEAWLKHLNVSERDFSRILNELHTAEIINLNSNLIEASGENLSLKDYIETRYRLEISNEQRALVVGDYLSKSIERASQIMMRFYRRSSALGLREFLPLFQNQSVPASLIDYAKFKENYKGLAKEEILQKLETENGKITLPQVFYSAHATAFYPTLRQAAEEERSAVALGFETVDYKKENEVAWIAAEIDSKLEGSAELAEFWCDRLEMVAMAGNFSKYQLWLITPEGFSPEAIEILNRRMAYGSSRTQIKHLAKYLKAENVIQEKNNSNEYEMIMPMGDDTELVAARAVEEIARRHDFQPKAITQIKTALVEACINASEHSFSPDGKIYQKFTIEDDKIVITISNRGVKIPSEKVVEMTTQIESDQSRRGWGLKLMRTLMDEVKFEQVDDGTRISMVKYLNK